MSRQSYAAGLKKKRDLKKRANRKDYITKYMWVGGRGTGKLVKHYSYDGGKTWTTSADRPKRDHNPEKKQSNIPKKEGKENNPDFGKKVYHQTPTPQKPSPEWGVGKDKVSGSDKLKVQKKDSKDTKPVETEQQFLERTKNSPAAKAGLSDKQRWAARQKYLEFKKKNRTSKEARKKRRDDRLKKRIKNSLKINKK